MICALEGLCRGRCTIVVAIVVSCRRRKDVNTAPSDLARSKKRPCRRTVTCSSRRDLQKVHCTKTTVSHCSSNFNSRSSTSVEDQVKELGFVVAEILRKRLYPNFPVRGAIILASGREYDSYGATRKRYKRTSFHSDNQDTLS